MSNYPTLEVSSSSDHAAYAPFGPISYIKYGNGLELIHNHDLAYRLGDIDSPTHSKYEYDFAYDAVGNITDITEYKGRDRTLVYDDLGRLTEFREPDNGNQLLYGFTYDGIGNRLSKQEWDGSTLNTTSYTYSSGSHRLSKVGFLGRVYDDAGNTNTGIVSQSIMTYDERNRLSQVTVAFTGGASYDYNGMGQRVFKDSGMVGNTADTVFVYGQNGQLLGEYPDGGNPSTEYIWLNGRPVGLIRDGNLYYIQSDHLGTPRRVIEPGTGTIRWHWPLTSEPFGEAQPNEDPDSTGTDFEFNPRFPGQYYDAEFGLHYNYFRDYEPQTGRYVQSDPMGLWGGISTFGYAEQNPIVFIDRFGLFPDQDSGPSQFSEPIYEFGCSIVEAAGLSCPQPEYVPPPKPGRRCKVGCNLLGAPICTAAAGAAGGATSLSGPGAAAAAGGAWVVCQGGKAYVCQVICEPEQCGSESTSGGGW